MTLNNTRELTREFIRRVGPMELKVDCPMDGNFHSQVAIVAEAPGEHEVRQRLPLVGGSGQLLWTVLHKIKFNRTMAYITNVCKRQVSMSSKGNERHSVSKHELEQWKAMLAWELEQLPNVRYVLILGGVALDACRHFMDTDSTAGVTMWRGSVATGKIAGRPVHFVITYNPAHVIREPKFELTFRFDIAKLKRVMDGKFQKYEIEAHINPSFKEAVEWIDMMQDAKVPISFDIEVVSGETACIGFADNDHRGYCVNLRTLDANRFSLFEERAIIQRFAQFFSDPSLELVAQNGIFDTAWLWYKDGIRVHHVWYDTLLAHHTLYSTLPHNLAYLTAQYTDHPFYKDEGKTWKEGGDIDKFWEYNVKDCCITRKVQGRTLIELKRDGLDKFFFNHVMRLQPHLVRMIVGGIKCDKELKDVVAEEMEAQVGALLNEFQALVHEATGDDGYDPNPNSWPQLQTLFFRKLKLVGRGTSTNAENRKCMRSHPRTPEPAQRMLDKLDIYKEEHKFLTTYAGSRLDPDERFRCEYKQFGTQSSPGRLSSAQTSWKTGMNLQNQPERSKGMFVADDGYVLLYFDLEQAEARYVAWDANIEQWKEDFERARLNPGSFDCHRSLASAMWGIPYDEVPLKDFDEQGGKTKRYIAKRCRHGLNYRMQAQTLATKTGLPFREALDAFNVYHHITPELRDWWEALTREVRANQALFSSYGRRLIILERLTDAAMESIVAFRPQSTIGDKVNEVIYLSHDHPRWPASARIALNNHDALIALSKPDDAMRCLSIMRKYAEEPIMVTSTMTKKIEPMIIPAECKMTTKRTKWRLDDDGKLEYYDDDRGQFRWSHLNKVDVEAAA